jgi:peptide/nickel transport system ATP-binding protein
LWSSSRASQRERRRPRCTLAWAIMRHLPANARELAGAIRLDGADLRAMTRRQIGTVRGWRVGMVF